MVLENTNGHEHADEEQYHADAHKRRRHLFPHDVRIDDGKDRFKNNHLSAQCPRQALTHGIPEANREP